MRLELEPRAAAFPLTSTSENSENPFAESQWNVDSLLKKGIAAAQSGDRDQARKYLSQATAVNPSNEEAWMWLASISEYPEELLAFLNRVLDINPDNQKAVDWRVQTKSHLATTFVQRALGARNDGSNQLANQFLDQALENDASCESAWFWKASLAEGDDQKVDFFQKVIDINPENTEAREAIARIEESRVSNALDKARLLAGNGNRDEASAIVRPLTEHESANVRESALMVLAATGETDDERMDFYTRVLEINPNNFEAEAFVTDIKKSRITALFDEARTAAAGGEGEKATRLLEDLLDQSPDYVDALLMLSHLSTSLDAKIGTLEKVLEIDPQNAAARSGLAYMALAFGSSKQAEVQPEAVVVDAEPPPVAVEAETPVAHDDVQPEEVFAESYSDESVETLVPAEHTPESVEFAYRQTEEVVVVDEEVEAESSAVFATEEQHFETTSAESEPTWAVRDEPDPTFEARPERPRSVEEIFGSFEPEADPEHETVVANFSQFETTPLNGNPFAAEEVFAPVSDVPDVQEMEPEFTVPETRVLTPPCPFCYHMNEVQAIECGECRSALTFSDLEGLLAGGRADKTVVQDAVTAMEAAWNTREFSSSELVNLSLGHLNLGNVESGLRYLQEASRLNPNDVILSGHANTVAIRLDEMKRHAEAVQSMPKGKTILVVDDSPTVRKLISGKLEKSGHNVVCAVDGVDALVKLEEGMPDLVLLDITMPRMDGYEVCKQIRANPAGKNLPVVMISGKDGFFDKVRGRMAGTSGYVTKPFGPETLMKALETYLLPDDAAVN